MRRPSACTFESHTHEDLACFLNGNSYVTPSGYSAGSIAAGIRLGTVPVLLSYEYVSDSFGVEARAGWAFNGGPKPDGGSSFLPVRLELRAKGWPLGAIPPHTGFRPFVHLGYGLAQVDVKAHDVTVSDGSGPVNVTVVKSLGVLYASAGGGLAYAISDGHALVLDLNLMLLFPSVGFAMEPLIGYQVAI